MNSSNRLLFAAARGAQIERPIAHDVWINTTQLWTAGNEDVRRIHPDDAHLQYGPISTAFQSQAENPSGGELLVVNHYWGLSSVHYSDWCLYRECAGIVGCSEDLHRSLFLLILAEALADEGL